MKKIVNLLVVAILLGFILDRVGESAETYFKIRSIQSRTRKDFAFIEVKYKCNVKKIENVELKIYAFLKKGSHEKVASGSVNLSEIEKGTHKEIFLLLPKHIDEYGTPRKFRAEIWYKDRIHASRTKPGSKEKWWEKDAVNIIIRSDEELEKLLRDYEEED